MARTLEARKMVTDALVRDVMSPRVRRIDARDTIRAVAEAMDAHDVGYVVLVEDGKVRGLVTDRDIVIRGIAKGLDPSTTPAWEIASAELAAIMGDAPVEDAIRLMRDKAVRRLLVVNSRKQLAGVVTLGDLVVEREPKSPLADISSAPPNR